MIKNKETLLKIIDYQEAIVQMCGKFRISHYEFIYALSGLVSKDTEIKINRRDTESKQSENKME